MDTMAKVRRIRQHLNFIERAREKQDYCSICKKMTDKKQVERDECCLEVCSICDKEYELPF